MSSNPIVKSFVENDGGSRSITVSQVATSPTTIQLIPAFENEEFSLPSAAPSSLDHQPLVAVINGSSTFGLRLKIDGGQIHPEGTIDLPPDRSAFLLATQRSLQGTDWSLLNLANYGDTFAPGMLRLKSNKPNAQMIVRTTDGKGRAHVYWNTQGGTSPKYADANEDAMKVTLHGSVLSFDAATGAGKSAGDPITWDREFEVGKGRLKVRNRELLAEIDDLKARLTALEAAAS